MMPMDVAAWLEDLKLSEYAQAFAENDIDADILGELTADDLRDIGVLKIGHRRKMLSAIAALGSPRSVPSHVDAPSSGNLLDPNNGVSEIAERRQLTVMFVDLAQAKDLAARHDPEDLQEILTRYQDAVAGVISRYQGFVAQYLGDGVLAYFGWPQAYEDAAERAVRAALEIRARVGDFTLPDGQAATTHIGIATGPVIVGELQMPQGRGEHSAIGQTPNLAARLQAFSAPNQVIIAPTTRALLGGLFQLENLGQKSLKGIDGPVELCAVVGETFEESRFAALRADHLGSPIVGRTRELEHITDIWYRARAGEGQMMLVSGEAGIGKSRITQAVTDELAPPAQVILQCSPYHVDSPFFPLVRHLTTMAGIHDGDSTNQKLTKLAALPGLDGGVAPTIAAVMGMDLAEQNDTATTTASRPSRAQVMQTLAQYFLADVDRSPLLMLIEDLHWSDPTTLEFLEYLLDEIESRPVMILGTARPSFDHRAQARPNMHRLVLNRLGGKQINDIIAAHTRGKDLPPDVVHVIAERTDGVPLFVEEMTRSLIESGALQELSDRFVLSGALADTVVPMSLNDSFMARLDRSQTAKSVALTAACIGREFAHSLIEQVSHLTQEQLQEGLDQLRASQLIQRRGHSPDYVYVFKHALLRDAAYENVMRGQRQDIHARILHSLQLMGTVNAEVLAVHAEAAGQTAQAIDFYETASKSAFARPAYAEAIAQLDRALQLLGPEIRRNTPQALQRAVALQVQKGAAILASFGHSAPETRAAYREALEMAERAGDQESQFAALFGLASSTFVHGGLQECIDIGHRYLKAAQNAGASAPMASAHRVLGNSYFGLGEIEEAQQHFEASKALFDPDKHKGLAQRYAGDLGVTTFGYMSLNYIAAGRTQVGLEHLDMCGHYASLVPDDVFSQCYYWTMGVMLHLIGGDDQALLRYAAPMLEKSTAHNMALYHAAASIGSSLSRLGQGDLGALHDFESAVAEVKAISSRMYLAFYLTKAGHQCLRLGQTNKATEFLRRVGIEQKQTETQTFVPETRRLAGRLAVQAGNNRLAEQEFEAARQFAKSKSIVLFELRAAIDLAELWSKTDRKGEVPGLVNPILRKIKPGDCSPEVAQAQSICDKIA